MSNKNRDENIGAAMGIGMCVIILALVQFMTLLEGDSDDIYLSQIEQAFAVCESNGGLYMIDGEVAKTHKFLCRNGAVFTYDKKRDEK